MKTSKKYHYQLVQNDKDWSAEIIRRVTAKVTVVTKRQDGLANEAEAKAWAEQEVKAFLKKTNLTELNKRRARDNK